MNKAKKATVSIIQLGKHTDDQATDKLYLDSNSKIHWEKPHFDTT